MSIWNVRRQPSKPELKSVLHNADSESDGDRWLPLDRYPRRLKRGLFHACKQVRWAGINRYCSVCRTYLARFLPAGDPPRDNALCPVCSSVERHRLIWSYIVARRLLAPAAVMTHLLHVAPEHCLRARLRRVKWLDYWTSSLDGRHARLSLDITKIPFEDAFFDAVICSHVLEHVLNDRAAMSEFFRVLKRGGWAILQVPIQLDRIETYEDATIVSPEDRKREFGQDDHVRIYGIDCRDRLRDAGFEVAFVRGEEVVGADIEYYGIDPSEPLIFCRRP